MVIRTIRESDYLPIITVVDEWWGERQMAGKLPRLFFKHFQNTSFVAEENEQILGFVVGFISQTCLEQAYIHFTGVHPDHRRKHIGKILYNKFFDTVRVRGCKSIHLITSPINTDSIAYHTKMGFEMEQSDTSIDDVWVHVGYDGPGEDRVVFVRRL